MGVKMNLLIDIKNIFVTGMLKPGTEFKIILGNAENYSDALFYMNGEKIFSPYFNVEIDYSDEINLLRERDNAK